ncbi:MAG: ASCH domain-containing protein [Desulfurococcales archaeon ex4484_217_2]|nr:MAG: ASCH domain-containing protein [Desulfurococcales archaeon ex4484_217_2]
MVKGEYVDLILKGVKKSTIRLGIIKPKYNEIMIHGGGKPIALAKITNVKYKRINELTDEDARKDGFPSLKVLLKELKKSYGEIRPNDIVTIIEFVITKKLSDLDVKEQWLGLKPVEIARIALRYCENIPQEERKILEDLTRTESIRKTAIRLYGSINRRWKIRKVLRKYLDTLVNKGIIKVRKYDSKKSS